jgi:hypothetical protein
MFATVELQSPVTINAVAVPEQAVIHSGERNVVVLSRSEGRFESRDVRLGVLAGGYYQVLDGIQEGEKIVVSSQFLLDSESNLKAVLQKMSPSGELPMPARRTSSSAGGDSASMKQSIPGEKKDEKMDEPPSKHTNHSK